jgi:hypothetical protein
LQKDFQTWWIRFIAYVNVCKFWAALKNGGKVSMPSSDLVAIDIATNAGKKAAAAKERNALAVANLTMAFLKQKAYLA